MDAPTRDRTERAITAQLTAMACESYEVGILAARGVMMLRTWSAAEVADAIPLSPTESLFEEKEEGESSWKRKDRPI